MHITTHSFFSSLHFFMDSRQKQPPHPNKQNSYLPKAPLPDDFQELERVQRRALPLLVVARHAAADGSPGWRGGGGAAGLFGLVGFLID
jgi:hypothetical protein